MFNYDWFNGTPYAHQIEEARFRCTRNHFPKISPDDWDRNKKVVKFRDELVIRTLLYLRDGFSYEIRELAELPSKSHLCFECMPVDEQYKVGAFVVTVPYEEISRVEVFAVHPSEKPDDLPQITGFRTLPPAEHGHAEGHPPPGR